MRKTTALVVIAFCITSSPLLAETHSHVSNEAGKPAIPAKKLQTDENLRLGMSNIAALLGTHWGNIRESRLDTADYRKLAKDIRVQLADVVSKCKLPRASDQVFHEILHDMNYGLDLMDAPRTEQQRAGALALGQALKNYGTYFEHPGWSLKL